MSGRLTPEQMEDARRARLWFRPAPPEAEVEDPDYGFDPIINTSGCAHLGECCSPYDTKCPRDAS